MCRMFVEVKKVAKSNDNEVRPEDAAIGAALADARKRAGLSQGEVAERAGWGSKDDMAGQKRVSAYETGRRGIGLPEFLAYAEAINTPPEKILGIFKHNVRPKN